jgi:hypothetical protein
VTFLARGESSEAGLDTSRTFWAEVSAFGAGTFLGVLVTLIVLWFVYSL